MIRNNQKREIDVNPEIARRWVRFAGGPWIVRRKIGAALANYPDLWLTVHDLARLSALSHTAALWAIGELLSEGRVRGRRIKERPGQVGYRLSKWVKTWQLRIPYP